MKLRTLLEDTENSFIIKKFDINAEDYVIYPFDIEVTYTLGEPSFDDHPYGNGSAREYHAGEVTLVSMETMEAVHLRDLEDEEKIVRTFPKGTSVSKIPGFDHKTEEYIYEKAIDHADR